MHYRNDPRNIENGSSLPKENYCDQPYVVVRPDGAWVVCLTTGTGLEGDTGQHVISSISRDQGKTWSSPVDIEPASAPESSWVMPYITEYGRIYVFYVFNKDNLRKVHSTLAPGYYTRVDTLGYMAYKYSDNGGESWSSERYYIPIRNFDIDNENPYDGKLQYFWGVGKPIRHKGALYLGYAKVGLFGIGFMEKDEGAFLKCANIETERDPAKLIWETLPEGTVGIRAPKGQIADEHNLVSLSDGSLFCTFRTVAGHNGQSFSRDDGKTWSQGEFAEYSPGGRLMKHPRAANFVRRYSNGKFTLWFHNHGSDLTDDPSAAYNGRNPAWLCGGIEKDGRIFWSQPEIVLYSKDPTERISYPDFIEDHGAFFITETQKTIARVHKVDNALLEAMWVHMESCSLAEAGLICEVKTPIESVSLPGTITPLNGDGLTLQLILDTSLMEPGCILDGRDSLKRGIALFYTAQHTLQAVLCDGERQLIWDSDPFRSTVAHVTMILDGAAGVLSFVLDGEFCDGGDARDYGFCRIDRYMGSLLGKGTLAPASSAQGLRLVRVYDRYLLTNEAAANYRYDKDRGLLC